MDVDLWIVPSGQAKIAAGRPISHDDLALSQSGLKMEGHGWLKIDKLLVRQEELPGREHCIKITLERLSEQEKNLRERHNEDLARIEQMRSEMLAIEAPKPVVKKEVEVDDDCPF